MNAKKNIDQLIAETIESGSAIDTVKTPPFFKEKVLQRLAQEEEQEIKGVAYLSWFTPKYQAAALICFVFVNLAAVFNSSDNYSEEVSSFAEVYGLAETDSDSYLYQN